MNYLPVRLKTLYGANNLLFDVYIKLPQKYLPYSSSGYAIDESRLDGVCKTFYFGTRNCMPFEHVEHVADHISQLFCQIIICYKYKSN